MTELKAAFYGDDFTGSVDALLQFSRAGLTGRLFIGRPSAEVLAAAAAEVDVVGLAGIARSLADPELTTEVRSALSLLRDLSPKVVQYKACSTADSSPTVGNLGRVIDIARELFGRQPIPVLFAQPDFGRYTVFGHHFAADSGTVYRLDRQPTMSAHPTTPMHESDLALHLSHQTTLPIGSLPFTSYAASPVGASLATGTDAAVVLDALDDGNIATVGAAIAGLHRDGHPVFAIGSGGLSTGLGLALKGGADGRAAPTVGCSGLRTSGPVLAVSGSRSPQTDRQVDQAVAGGWSRFDLATEAADPARAVQDQVLNALASGRSVVVTTGKTPRTGGPDLVDRLSGQLAAVVRTALTAGSTRRIIVCGGDTSSRVVAQLGAESLQIAANPTGNVVICRVSAAADWLDGTEMLLKGGQVGDVDLFGNVQRL